MYLYSHRHLPSFVTEKVNESKYTWTHLDMFVYCISSIVFFAWSLDQWTEENIQEELDDDPSIAFSAKRSEKSIKSVKSQKSDEANGERRPQNGEKSQKKDEKGILVRHHD